MQIANTNECISELGGRDLKAVIMAGGEGKRLKAVSGERPKPMVELLGKPMMEHIIELLKNQGFTDICAAVKYRAEDIMEYFGNGEKFGVNLSYRVEKEALGTAGGVKNCKDFYGDEDFLVISGDAACDFRLNELMEKHKEEKAAVSIALHRDSEPLSYGLAVTDEGSIVHAFIEKPKWQRVVTDLVNTGIYVISPSAMELVPDGQPYDFGKQLFPQLLESGRKVLGIPLEGYWCDVGTPLSYYKCCVDALSGCLKINPAENFIPAKDEDAEEQAENSSFCLECPCKSRAQLMGALSEALLDMGADYSDGIRLVRPRFNMHISPLSKTSALRIAVSSEDTEYAKSLALSARELAEAFNL